MATDREPNPHPTTFIALQAPPLGRLRRYGKSLRPQEQPSSANVPVGFLDAMIVREEVFVREQAVPLENEFDEDDPRSWHWLLYSLTEQAPGPAPATNGVLEATRSRPVGTVRVVPFPHPPHPKAGASYVDGREVLPDNGRPDPEPQPAPDQPAHDRATSFHDGHEPYVKLGRLAVVEDMRGRGYARSIVNAALEWARQGAGRFSPGRQAEWRGLVCVHAQTAAAGWWARMGFEVDELMGKWYEEGIEHVGMWKRLAIMDD